MVSSVVIDSRRQASALKRTGAVLMVLGAAVALGITTYRYVTPLSGITGAGGALLTMAGELLLVLMGLALFVVHGARARRTILILSWLFVILTLIAAMFLHGWITAAFLALTAIGVVVQTFSDPRGA